MLTASLPVTLVALTLGQVRDDSLSVNPTLLVSSSHTMALAGAWVGIAEGADGLSTNYASVAHRSPHLDRSWDWDLTFSGLTLPVRTLRDLDNDKRSERVDGPLEAQWGAMVQYRRLGVGVFVRTSTRDLCITADCTQQLDTVTAVGGLVAGASFLEAQLNVALGFHLSSAAFTMPSTSWSYNGSSAGVGVLWRPHRQPFRLGLQLTTAHIGALTVPPATPVPLGPVYRSTVTPARLSVGASVRLGEGNARYNNVPKVLIDELPTARQKDPPPSDRPGDGPPGRVLLTMQLEVLAPSPVPATTVNALVLQQDAPVVGSVAAFVARVGVEWEALVKRLRLRGGAWLEPGLVRGTTPRPHLTAGAELFLFHLWQDWSLSAFADFAPGYFAAGGGIGVWQ